MTIDEKGNVYLTTNDKPVVEIFSSSGKLLDTIEVPEKPTNVCFGGKDRNQLYITARTTFYRIEMNTRGVN
ncbi:MAG: SMP-30/gluconolactonase/LRE family protein [Bacteroidales bacterium]